MRKQAKNIVHTLLTTAGFRAGAIRKAFMGPYHGLNFHLTPPMAGRLRIFYTGYEPEVQVWLKQNIRPEMTVFIVGAHAGIHVLYVARLLQECGRVYAFEGWKENFAALKANIAVNPTLQSLIFPIAACVSSESGTLLMAEGTSDGKHRVATGSDDDQPQASVEAVALDDFVAEKQVVPDLILMDIEGHELYALNGSTELINAHKPLLLLEHHENWQALQEWLRENDYRVESLGRRHLVGR